jgi:L-ascorbate metabolism protein UlaG (beta-lactamase superfamily)
MKRVIFKAFSTFLMASILCCILGIPEASEGKVPIKLYYSAPAQIELISARGTRVFIDVTTPEALSSPPTEKDVLLTTHNHGDHRRLDFVKIFPAQQLDVKIGEIKMEDVMIRGIASAHNEGDEFRSEGGTNYIFIVDMGGLRIAHFGDIGQNALTPEQLAALGKVDIAITQLSNPFSGMNAGNKKGFNLMDQVKPRLIIPTHIFESTCTKMAVDKWTGYKSSKKFISISPEDLSGKTSILFMGQNAVGMNLPDSSL